MRPNKEREPGSQRLFAHHSPYAPYIVDDWWRMLAVVLHRLWPTLLLYRSRRLQVLDGFSDG